MARRPGHIDAAKREAVLHAALDVLAEVGAPASLSEIAARAGVSRQTLYNHYRGKSEVIAALLAEHCARLEPPCICETAAPPADALAEYGEALVRHVSHPFYARVVRVLLLNTAVPDDQLSRALSVVSAKGSLAAYFASETQRGRLKVIDPAGAAELFLDLVVAGPLLRSVLQRGGTSHADDSARHIEMSARMFVAFYAPDA